MLTKETNTEQIDKQACKWLSIMNSDQKSDAEVADFHTWLEADPHHQMAHDHVNVIWTDLEDLQGAIEPEDYRVSDESMPWQKTGLQGFLSKTMDIRYKPFQFAVVSSMLLAIYLLWPGFERPVYNNDSNGEYATQTAELRNIELPDGSTVTLGALSAIEVKYRDSERRIELVSGDAFFSVASNPNRPFIVSTTNAFVRAVGTMFDVRRSNEGVRISVLEGLVEVTQFQAKQIDGVKVPEEVTQVLLANQKIYARSDGDQTKPQTIETDLPGAWREGRLIYEKANLSVVISDADRYYGGNIIIDTIDLKDLPVSAAFRTDQINEMMDTLSAVLPISVKRLSNGDIILRRSEHHKS